MSYIIQIYGRADSVPSRYDGAYLQGFYDTRDGIGDVLITRYKDKAKQFPNAGEAWEFWRQQSKLVPLRPDGKPNRPLTAFTVDIARFE